MYTLYLSRSPAETLPHPVDMCTHRRCTCSGLARWPRSAHLRAIYGRRKQRVMLHMGFTFTVHVLQTG